MKSVAIEATKNNTPNVLPRTSAGLGTGLARTIEIEPGRRKSGRKLAVATRAKIIPKAPAPPFGDRDKQEVDLARRVAK